VPPSSDPVSEALSIAGVSERPSLLARLRDYHLLFPNLTVRMANTMSSAALPLLLVSLAFPPGQVGTIVSLGGLSSVAMTLVGGLVSDYFGKKRLMLAGIIGVAMAAGLLGVARAAYQFVVLRMVQGLATGLFRPASQALAYELNPQRRAYVIGLLGSSYVLGNALGPPVAGYVGDRHGLGVCMAVAGLFGILAGLYLLAAWRALPAPVSRPQPLRRQIGVLFSRRRRQSLVPMSVVMMDAWILNCWHVFLPIYLKHELSFSYTQIGLLVGLESGVYVLAQPLAGRLIDRIGVRIPLAVSIGTHGLFIAAVPLIGATWWILLCLVLVGVTNSAAHPGSVLLTARLSTDDDRGASLGLLSSASNLGQFLGPMIGGAIIAASGDWSYALYACVVPALIGAVCPFFLSKEPPKTHEASST
jgi:MFS transporter, DHA1 family, multidrug resistance protein